MTLVTRAAIAAVLTFLASGFKTPLRTDSSRSLKACDVARRSHTTRIRRGHAGRALRLRLAMKVIDSHLHVWGDGAAPYPYAESGDPPATLKTTSGPNTLLPLMASSGVSGALIVQPINYGFDHSYVESVLRAQPGRFKGMCLADPSLPPEEAANNLIDLHQRGFGSVRFNPALWPAGGSMADATSRALFAACAELRMPVGFMCFKGLAPYAADIAALIESLPPPMANGSGTGPPAVIIDHFGFFRQDGKDDGASWAALLALARYPQEPYPYRDLHRRFAELLAAFGARRLMFGTDFPYVVAACGYREVVVAAARKMRLSAEDAAMVMGGTAEAVFGAWGQ